LAKAYFDCLGHYARFDLLSLNIREEAWTPTGPKLLDRPAALPDLDRRLTEIANRYEVDLGKLEGLIGDLLARGPSRRAGEP
ncbi:MAG: hypothetical protein HY613_04550, partial [Candidatus Rokubacteria bacterium]|nr:hypothetical protein [Candidatus Rokubacteria bacterium]